MEGHALCAVEETNLANYKEAYIRIKSWVTSHRMQITYKHGTSFTTDNYTHWIFSTQNYPFHSHRAGRHTDRPLGSDAV